jgi:hypothetical protein
MRFIKKLPPQLSAPATRARIRKALEEAGRPAGLEPFQSANTKMNNRPPIIKSLPVWVRRFGIAAEANQCVLWCEPRPGPEETFPSQVIIDVPSGRFMVETLDTVTARWVSRESAEGGPLVAGLSYTGHPVLVWIRPLP